MRKIIIEQGNEFKIYNRKNEVSEDIFREQYELASTIVNDLIHYSEKVNQDNQGEETWEHLNNLIAFCGERGQGKSSAMIQFTRKLRECNQIEVLNTIDPTAMETVHDILDIVVSRMFESYRNDRANMNYTGDDFYDQGIISLNKDQQLEMSGLFQKVHKNLAILKNSDKFIKDEYIYSGSIQNLADIADSMKIKQDMEKLVKEYLAYRKRKIIVVSLDDLDLNISAAYNMMEQIRKYMMIPEIIIVMAVNISQLTLCIERQFLLEMKGLEQSLRWDMAQEARKMASKYIEKLFPMPRRIVLPDIRTISSGGKNAVELLYRNQEGTIFDSNMLGIEKGVMQLLYKRTGLILVAEENSIHPLIPNTLRELVGLVSVIGTMEEKDKKRNVELFEDYLFDFWVDNHLEEKERQWFIFLRGSGEIGIQNAIFLHLYEWIEEKKRISYIYERNDALTRKVEETFRRLNKNGKKVNNGELLNCIRLCHRANEYNFNKLLFAIKTYLSIIMLKLKYDYATEKLIWFIGDSIFGTHLLIRKETVQGSNNSRTYYGYNLIEYWKHFEMQMESKENNIVPFLDKTTVNAIKNYTKQFVGGDEALKQRLYAIGSVSDFRWSNESSASGMVADNNMIAPRAIFSINKLFIRQISDKTVYQNINGEKWGIKPEEFATPTYWNHFREMCNILLCNIELVAYIGKYIASNRDIKDKVDNSISVYYNYFFENLIKGLHDLNLYLEFDTKWNVDIDKDYHQLANILAEFWESMKLGQLEDPDNEERDDEEKDNEVDIERYIEKYTEYGSVDSYELLESKNSQGGTGRGMPSGVKKNSRVGILRSRLKSMKAYIDSNNENFTDLMLSSLYDDLKILYEEFEVYAKNNSDKQVINSSLSEKYNSILRRLQ